MFLSRKTVSLVLSYTLFSTALPVFSPANQVLAQDRDDSSPGLQFRLSTGAEQPEQVASNKVAETTELPRSEIDQILSRLTPIETSNSDVAEFTLREGSIPPPRTGKTVTTAFPGPSNSDAPAPTVDGPLEVVRFAPEGDVQMAPNLTVTFSQPMVPVSSQEEAATYIPVRISPQPSGKWRWLGTRTLLFEPAGKFPMATRYSVTVPGETRAASGKVISESKIWSFSTPAPKLKTAYPARGTTERRDTLMFVSFDQRIDAAAVLKVIKVSSGGKNFQIRPATTAEINSNDEIKNLAKEAGESRWMSFRAIDGAGKTADVLPAASDIRVTIGPKVPSAEGDLTSSSSDSFTFKTFAPFVIEKTECGYSAQCSPDDYFTIEFNNNIDEESLDASRLQIKPAVPDLSTEVYGNELQIKGSLKPRTVYQVRFNDSIKDEFGQRLAENKSITFSVGPAGKFLFTHQDDFVVLDPHGALRFPVFSRNFAQLKVQLYTVSVNDWPAWAEYRHEEAKNPRPPGKLIQSKTIKVVAAPDEFVETSIDLKGALNNGLGHVILIVEPVGRSVEDGDSIIRSWIQRTEVGLEAFSDNGTLVVWANSLRDGTPLRDVEVSLAPEPGSHRTSVDGFARLELKPATKENEVNFLVARRGNDVAILPEEVENFYRRGGWHRKENVDDWRWYVFDDRGLYKPSEDVHVKGWLRRHKLSPGSDLELPNTSNKKISYILYDGHHVKVGDGTTTLNTLGGFDFVVTLPANMNLGDASLEFHPDEAPRVAYRHSFKVAEFRRPEFEVRTKLNTAGPLLVGGHADLSATATYFAGGGLPNAAVSWSVKTTPADFTPPNRSDFTFGKWSPWWLEKDDDSDSQTKTLTGSTDASGTHRLRIDFETVDPPRPSTVEVEAQVTDVNRQRWIAEETLLVHPSSLYVGLKSDKTFVHERQPMVVDTIVTDIDGVAVPNREVNVTAVRLDWRQEKGEWKQFETDPQSCSLRSGADALKCTFAAPRGGTYRVTAMVRDERERRHESELTLWVAGAQTFDPDREENELELIPDARDYRPGDTAEVMVQAPFYPAEGVFTLDRYGITQVEHFQMSGPTHILRIPIQENWTPNVHLQVSLVGNQSTSDNNQKQAAVASGKLELKVLPVARKLEIVARPEAKVLEPGQETNVSLEARDSSGRAVPGAEVAVVVVDEAILALTHYKLGDPIESFYVDRETGVSGYSLRGHLLYLKPLRAVEVAAGGPGAGVMVAEIPPIRRGMITRGGVNAAYARSDIPHPATFPIPQASPGPPIRVRKNFDALATFAPAVTTDANGRAQVKVKLPDNLTRYRVMAVAVSGSRQFGSGESAITARLPVMARPSAPRFLNFGDRFELPVVLQNQTDRPLSVDVVVRASNAVVDSSDRAGRRVAVPANDRVEVRLPATTLSSGTARFQIVAVSGSWADASNISLPVWTPATTEAFATYGELDQGAMVQPVKPPANVFTQFGGLEIETSSTQLQQLTDAFLYLHNYPYECSEQIASRVLSVAALRDVLQAFKHKDLPPASEIEAAVNRDITRLQALQNDDGGFGFWRKGERDWPFLGVHVAHALIRAKQKNFAVPQTMLDKSAIYLRSVESRIPSEYSIDTKRSLIAYSLYVRMLLGERDAAQARKLLGESDPRYLAVETMGWLLAVLTGDAKSQAEISRLRAALKSRVSETAATAHFVSSYGDDDYLVLNSSRRADAVVLDALIADDPKSDLIPKVTRGLLDHRTQGRWESTQENVFVLLALDRYFQTYEKVTPEFVARVWLGNGYAGERRFNGRSVDRQRTFVPMSYVAKHSTENLVISKDGPGRLYYRIAMNYAPLSLEQKPADYGFAVQRTYEAIDSPGDVKREADGSWSIKSGARVRVRVTMAAPSRRYHVALVDSLPAGFETLNPELAATESVPADPKLPRNSGAWWLWRSVWFDHQNLRDNRSEAFATLLWGGVYNYSYVARATTPGVFVAPPAKAEEMYHPETFGRSSSDRVKVH